VVVALLKTHRWIECPLCRNDDAKRGNCNLCSSGADANPGYVKVPVK